MRLPRSIALLGSVLLGCVINVGEDNCSECDNSPRCHSTLDEATDTCWCDPGHEWANPANDNDFECRRIPARPGTSDCIEDNSFMQGDSCFCRNGYNWCSDDPNDLTCCEDDQQAPELPEIGTGTGGDTDTDTDGAQSGGRIVELPECTADLEGQLGCTSPDPDAPEPTLLCMDGEWVEYDQDAHCQGMDMGDFGYGCHLREGDVVVLCGEGPGGSCTAEDETCVDATTLHECVFERLTARDCTEFCMSDSGTCEMAECVC